MTTDLDPGVEHRGDAPSAPGSARPDETLLGLVARGVPLVLAGALLGGAPGALVALLGVLGTARRSTAPVTVVAALLVLGAAVATMVEAPLSRQALSSSFADQRPVAAACATAAGILLLVVAVTLTLRLPRPATPAPGRDGSGDPAATEVTPWTARLAGLAAPVALGLAALVALGLTAPAPPLATREVATQVRLGTGWGRLVDGTVRTDATSPPLPVAVTAMAPGPTRWWTAAAGVAAMALVAATVARRAGARTALVAGGATGVVLVVARADLAACLAAALMAAALALGDPETRTTGRAALAGAAFGAACLCLPAAIFLLPVLAAALALHPRTGEVSVGQGAAAVGAALVVWAPWQRWVLDRASTWAPAASLVVPTSVVVAGLAPAAVVAVALAVSGRRAAGEATPTPGA